MVGPSAAHAAPGIPLFSMDSLASGSAVMPAGGLLARGRQWYASGTERSVSRWRAGLRAVEERHEERRQEPEDSSDGRNRRVHADRARRPSHGRFVRRGVGPSAHQRSREVRRDLQPRHDRGQGPSHREMVANPKFQFDGVRHVQRHREHGRAHHAEDPGEIRVHRADARGGEGGASRLHGVLRPVHGR